MIDRAFDTAYSALRLWEEREKYNPYHFFFYKTIAALVASLSGFVQSIDAASSLNTPQLAFQSRACTLLPDPP
jgi:hypothetical protein